MTGEAIQSPPSSAPAAGQLGPGPSPAAEGLGAPPPVYASTTPLGQVYSQLRTIWTSLDAMTAGERGVPLEAQKRILASLLAQSLSAIQEIDEGQSEYTQQLVAYGNTLRAQLTTLQAECIAPAPGAGAVAPGAGASPPPAGAKFTAGATGLIALGAAVVGGMLGFGSARALKPGKAEED